MEKKVWWQVIKLFYKENIIPTFFPADFEEAAPNFCKALQLFLFAPIIMILSALFLPSAYTVFNILGFSVTAVYLPLYLYAIFHFTCSYLPRKLWGAQNSIRSYFFDLFARAKKEVVDIKAKEEAAHKEKIRKHCKETIERYAEMLEKIGPDEEHREIILEIVRSTLKLENLTLEGLGIKNKVIGDYIDECEEKEKLQNEAGKIASQMTENISPLPPKEMGRVIDSLYETPPDEAIHSTDRRAVREE